MSHRIKCKWNYRMKLSIETGCFIQVLFNSTWYGSLGNNATKLSTETGLSNCWKRAINDGTCVNLWKLRKLGFFYEKFGLTSRTITDGSVWPNMEVINCLKWPLISMYGQRLSQRLDNKVTCLCLYYYFFEKTMNTCWTICPNVRT
jgi:hypothetical protein